MKYTQCLEVINSRPPDKDRSLLIMKRMNKEKRKRIKTVLRNEILANSREDNYIVQNSLIDGQVENDIQKNSTFLSQLSPNAGGKLRGSLCYEINLNNNINNIPSEKVEEMNIKS